MDMFLFQVPHSSLSQFLSVLPRGDAAGGLSSWELQILNSLSLQSCQGTAPAQAAKQATTEVQTSAEHTGKQFLCL